MVSSNRQAIFHYYTYKKGLNKSSRTSIDLTMDEKRSNQVQEGIHLFRTRAEARNYKKATLYSCDKIARCICQVKDLVGVGWFQGYRSLVFTKVRVTDFI